MKKQNIGINIVIIAIVYLAMQFVGSLVVMGVYAVCHFDEFRSILSSGQNPASMLTVDLMGWALIVSSLLTVLVLALMKQVQWSSFRVQGSDFGWKWTLFVFVATVCAIFGLDVLQEFIKLPNLIEKNLVGMSSSIPGILAMALVGPITEEIAFREAICGGMLRAGKKPWTAILVSSLVFGLIHMNPAQIPFAIAAGVVMAIVYVKTQSIISSCIIHVLNNAFAVWMMIKYSDQGDISFSSMIGSETLTILLGIAGLVIGTLLYIYYWKNRK